MKISQSMTVFVFVLLLTSSLPGPKAWAESEEVDFDSIVSDLAGSSRMDLEDPDPLNSVWLHGGVGFVAAFLELRPPNGSRYSGFLSGIEASFGIDLFSQYWRAEGSLRSFNSDRITRELGVSLKEFDLKVIYSTPITHRLDLNLGCGLAARYLRAQLKTLNSETQTLDYTTPASILTTGVQARLTRSVGLGADLSWRGALIAETMDRNSLEGVVRLNAQF